MYKNLKITNKNNTTISKYELWNTYIYIYIYIYVDGTKTTTQRSPPVRDPDGSWGNQGMNQRVGHGGSQDTKQQHGNKVSSFKM